VQGAAAHVRWLGTVQQRQINLTFHGIGAPNRPLDRGEADVWLTEAQFFSVLDVVGPRDDILITFDDGNVSDVENALPALRARGLRARFFVCAGRLGRAGFVNEDDVRELRSAGMSIGSHGMHHVRWRKMSQSDIQCEIVEAKQVLEDALEAPVEEAACPFGAYDRRSLSALRDAGFKRVYSSDGGPTSAKDWVVARNTVHRWDSAKSVEGMLTSSGGSVSLTHKARRSIKRWR
jgi:peptidoglycan/xylan/chitin deacetylase (PgdA/CDA1 family)